MRNGIRISAAAAIILLILSGLSPAAEEPAKAQSVPEKEGQMPKGFLNSVSDSITGFRPKIWLLQPLKKGRCLWTENVTVFQGIADRLQYGKEELEEPAAKEGVAPVAEGGKDEAVLLGTDAKESAALPGTDVKDSAAPAGTDNKEASRAEGKL